MPQLGTKLLSYTDPIAQASVGILTFKHQMAFALSTAEWICSEGQHERFTFGLTFTKMHLRPLTAILFPPTVFLLSNSILI